ncbi:MAG: site-specific integrase [Candidatus Kapabacteria bacterium]|nr:site-specific integrase [Candidatus Kapabacteria bacterium]
MARYNINYYIDNKNYIFIDINWHHNRVRCSIGIKLDDKNNWDLAKKRFKSSSKFAFQRNKRLNEISNTVSEFFENRLMKIKSIEKSEIVELVGRITGRIKEPEAKQFLEHFQDLISKSEAEKIIQSGTIKCYQSTLNHLKNFEQNKKCKLDFNIDWEEFYINFRQYLNNKGMANNSAGKHFKNVKKFLNYSLKKGIHSNSSFITAIKVEKRDPLKLALKESEILMIYRLENLPPKLEVVKDMFVLQCQIGARVSDYFSFKPENIDLNSKVLSYTTQKTKRFVKVPLSNLCLTILSKYPILPRLNKNSYNNGIKIICDKAGINTNVEVIKFIGNQTIREFKSKSSLISSHTARRTLVSCLSEKGVSPEHGMQITGHTDYKSYKRYICTSQDEAVESVREVLNSTYLLAG